MLLMLWPARLLSVYSSCSETSSFPCSRGVAFTLSPISMYSAFGNWVPSPPVEAPNNAAESRTIAAEFDPKFETATSGKPSPLKSAVAAELGLVCNGSSSGDANVPPPVPIKTARELSPCAVTAMSGSPSSLKSAIAIDVGFVPAA